MTQNNQLVILNDSFKKEGTDQEVEGLTVIIDGTIKTAFDTIKVRKGYDSYNEVMRDVIFSGLEKVLKSD